MGRVATDIQSTRGFQEEEIVTAKTWGQEMYSMFQSVSLEH